MCVWGGGGVGGWACVCACVCVCEREREGEREREREGGGGREVDIMQSRVIDFFFFDVVCLEDATVLRSESIMMQLFYTCAKDRVTQTTDANVGKGATVRVNIDKLDGWC